MAKYCINLFKYNRYQTQEVNIGDLKMGGNNPIVVQSMTTTNTNDTEATVKQIESIIDAGGQMVRMTSQGRREAKNLENIKKQLLADGYTQPLVADIHFNPNAANIAAQHIEKVRINPGNFVDGAKKFEDIEYTNESYYEELEQVKDKLIPLLNICKENNTALRIGTNHGSLSDRIMSRYGDTPQGMVEACMEFLRICKEEDFNNIVLSIKASNARIMVHTVRLLVQKMNEEEMYFPLHLGVTEAGEGEDGRIRSAVGIGTLLTDGIGDTIRVSLTEDPEKEIPVAKALIQYIETKAQHKPIEEIETNHYFPFKYIRHNSHKVNNIGETQVPIVISEKEDAVNTPDYLFLSNIPDVIPTQTYILPYKYYNQLEDKTNAYPCLNYADLNQDLKLNNLHFVKIKCTEINEITLRYFSSNTNSVIIIESENKNSVAEQRAAFLQLANHKITNPVIIHKLSKGNFNQQSQLEASCDIGPLLIDGFGDGIFVQTEEDTTNLLNKTMFAILQASRVRFTKPDYISCPGCGRTLFNLQHTTALVKAKTTHLKGLKIAVMGCIVNGPGEMADADYGYVGSGPGKITLYHQREVVKKNIEEKNAINELISLIKEKGDWIEPEA